MGPGLDRKVKAEGTLQDLNKWCVLGLGDSLKNNQKLTYESRVFYQYNPVCVNYFSYSLPTDAPSPEKQYWLY